MIIVSISFTRGQGIVVQNAGNLCFANQERIQSPPLLIKFRAQEINFDTIQTNPNTAGFLSNNHQKLFLATNNGTNISPSFSTMTSIYTHPFLYKGNAVSGRFNFDNLTDYAVINAFGDIVALKNMGFPTAFQKDSMGNSFILGHTCSKLLKCNLDGAGAQDLVSVGVKSIATQSFVLRPYVNTTPASTAAPLSFVPQSIRVITGMPSFTNYNYDVEAADLDNNGKDELIFTSEVLDSIYVIYSTAGILDKQFQFSPGIGFTLKKIVVSDLNGDGSKEIIVSAKTASNGINYVAVYTPIYLSGIIIGLNNFNPVIANYEISDINYADLNADGYKDLVVSQATPTTSTSGNINIYMHDRTSTNFQFSNAPINFNILSHITGGLAIADVDNNKRPDIISFARSDSSSISILKNFTFRDSLFAVPNKTAICVGDTMIIKNQLIGFPGPYFTTIVPSLSVVASINHTTTITSSGNYACSAMFGPYLGGTCIFTSNTLVIQQGLQPNLNVVGQNSVCYGAPLTLTATGAGSYTWTTTSGTITSNILSLTPTTAVIYVLSGSSLNGCRAFYPGTVTVKPDFNATVTFDRNFLCKDQKATLTAGGGNTYSWTTGANTQNIVITQTSTTAQIYGVYITNTDGCTKYAGFVTSYNDKCKEVVVIKGITPNSDGNNHLYIENIDQYPKNIVTIYNRWGVQLYTQEGYNNMDKVWPTKNTSNLAAGTYYYVVELGPGNGIKKGWVEIFSN